MKKYITVILLIIIEWLIFMALYGLDLPDSPGRTMLVVSFLLIGALAFCELYYIFHSGRKQRKVAYFTKTLRNDSRDMLIIETFGNKEVMHSIRRYSNKSEFDHDVLNFRRNGFDVVIQKVPSHLS